jgi:hypothetical protein
MSELATRIQDQIDNKYSMHRKKWTFSLEEGRGTTYSSGKPTLYGHSRYERSSVLAGQHQRVFLDQWDSWEEARAALAEVKKTVKRFKCDDLGPEGGSTFTPVNVNHLPDDTDY